MPAKRRFTKAQIQVALEKTKGMVYLAADNLGCSAETVYDYMRRYPDVRAEWERQSGKVTDTAELKLFQAIIAGEHWAIAFYLRTKGRNRGYVERNEITGVDGGAIAITEVIIERSTGRQADDEEPLAD